jgi:hypothetical protein
MMIFGEAVTKENVKRLAIKYKTEIAGLVVAFILGALLF